MPTPARRRSLFTARLVNTTVEGAQPRVVDDLRQAILAGDEPPGTLIPIEAVARFFGVSQIPVRESLKVLLGEGLVEHVPHVGYSVAKLAFAEFRELYDVRQALESSALGHAVARAGPADDDAARRTHDEMGAALVGADDRGYHAASRAFHLALMEPARMARLLHMYEAAWNMTEPARPMAHMGPADRQTFYDDHARMLDAFAARDPARLIAECDRHYEHLRRAIDSMRDDAETFREG